MTENRSRYGPSPLFLLLAVALACFVVGGCLKTHDPETGRNTSWLRSCAVDTECDDGLGCRCGVCTDVCATDDDCRDSESATCEETGNLAGQCAPDSLGTAEKVCMLSCTTDQACREQQDDLACSGGICLDPETANPGGVDEPPVPPGSTDAGADTSLPIPPMPDASSPPPPSTDGGMDGPDVEDSRVTPGTQGAPCMQSVEHTPDDADGGTSVSIMTMDRACEAGLVCAADDTCQPSEDCKGEPGVICRLGKLPTGVKKWSFDGTHIVWLEEGTYDYLHNYQHDGKIMMRSVGGGNAEEFATGQEKPHFVEVAGDHVYWINTNEQHDDELWPIWRARKDGSDTPVKLANNVREIVNIVVDETYLYWRTWHSLWRVKKTGNDPAERMTFDIEYNSFAVDDTHYYWVRDTYLMRRLKSDDQNAKLQRIGNQPIVLGKQHVVFKLGSYVRRVPKAGGERVNIGGGFNPVRGLAVHDETAYWCSTVSDESGSVIRKAPVDMSSMQQVAVEHFAAGCEWWKVTDDGLYWLDGRSIMTLPWK